MISRIFVVLVLAVIFWPAIACAQSLAPVIIPFHGSYVDPGPLKINWQNPITTGLSLIFVFNGPFSRPLYISRGAANLAVANTPFPPMTSPEGGSLTGSESATATYTVPTIGSVVAYVYAKFAPTDSLAHEVLQISNGTNYFDFAKWSDNDWHCGWIVGSDFRVTVAASGSFNAGDSFTAGCSWAASTAIMYVKGRQVGSPASGAITTTSTSGYTFSIGASTAANNEWNNGSGGAVYYEAIFDRVLSPAEFFSLQNDPMQLFITQTDILMSNLVGAVSVPNSGFFAPSVPW